MALKNAKRHGKKAHRSNMIENTSAKCIWCVWWKKKPMLIPLCFKWGPREKSILFRAKMGIDSIKACHKNIVCERVIDFPMILFFFSSAHKKSLLTHLPWAFTRLRFCQVICDWTLCAVRQWECGEEFQKNSINFQCGTLPCQNAQENAWKNEGILMQYNALFN